ncbi:Uma2 family endonuclease [Thermus sp. SYSU G05001]|uniref:Uma2 family endonuclease n=1 Tax=Thermus brevis TaxID=2862456 RepID=A0ABS6ZW41_9DEIN|nr:Uma2 family endonuclease [Thermus brevis]
MKNLRAGYIFSSESGFRFPSGAVLSPDAAFEIRSRSPSPEEPRQKAQAYLAQGVHLVVLLDPYAHQVEVLRPDREERCQDPESLPIPAWLCPKGPGTWPIRPSRPRSAGGKSLPHRAPPPPLGHTWDP